MSWFSRKKNKPESSDVSLLDKNDAEYWKTLQPKKNHIRITDGYSLILDLDENSETDGYREPILRKYHFENIDDFFEIVMYECKSFWIVVKIVDEAFEIRVMREIDEQGWFESGNRQSLIDKSYFAPFEEPFDEDGNSLVLEDGTLSPELPPSELSFSPFIFREVKMEDGDLIEFEFKMKDQGEVIGFTKIIPEQSGLSGNIFTTLNEYQASDDCPAEQLLLIEMGGLNEDPGEPEWDDENEEWFFPNDFNFSPEGGFIQLFLGSAISLDDIQVI